MKRVISLILCVLMLVPCFAFDIGAADENEITNIAPTARAYHSSIWNNDRGAKYLNNGILDHNYQFWESSAPQRPNGAGVDPTIQYCGYRFNNYYAIDEVVLYVKKWGEFAQYDEDGKLVKEATTDNNIKYTIVVLMQGEEYTVGHAYDIDAVETGMKGIGKITIKLNKPADVDLINTKNIRIDCTEYGDRAIPHHTDKSGTSTHDWWKVPLIQEFEVYGKLGPIPEFDVPEGAVLSTNAALSGLAGATSTSKGYYPALGNDNVGNTYWRANEVGGGQEFWVEFDNTYAIVDVSVNFSGVEHTGIKINYDISVLVGDTWKTVVSGKEYTTKSDLEAAQIFEIDRTNASGIKITINSAKKGAADQRAVVTEVGATIADGKKCIFLKDYIDSTKQESTATGNLACYGSAYASSSFEYSNIAEPKYINDGKTTADSPSWIAADKLKGTYCGVKLREAHTVSKVVLYFNDPIIQEDLLNPTAEHVMTMELQAWVNGKYETLKTITSFDTKTNRYEVSVLLDTPVNTNDIRIVYLSNGLVFPYLKEIEIFDNDFIYSAYAGFPLPSSRKIGGKDATDPNDFGVKSSVRRARYMDLISPIQYFDLLTQSGITPEKLV